MTDINGSAGNVIAEPSHSSPEHEREDHHAVVETETHHIVAGPQQDEEEDDVQVIWSRSGGLEPRNGDTEPRNDGTEPQNGDTEPRHDGTGPQDDGTGPRDDGTGPRDDGTEPRDESTDAAVPETVQKDVENPRKRKSNVEDEEATEPAAPSQVVPDLCTICYEPLLDFGDHRICCLVCGHLFGLKCIERWLRDCGKRKCPQCLRKARKEDIRVLFTPQIIVADGRSIQEILDLTNENTKLKSENSKLKKTLQSTKVRIWEKKLAALEASGRPSVIGNTAGDGRNTFLEPGHNKGLRSGIDFRYSRTGADFENLRVPENIQGDGRLQNGFQINSNRNAFNELMRVPVNGSKAFDMDASTQTLLFSHRTGESGSGFGLTLCKMSLLDSRVIERMNIQSDLGAIRDIRTAGPGQQPNLALVASMKNLSMLSMESNSVVLSHDVSSPAWSCAWDPCNPTLIYSGLQNGSLLIFDIRQTASPIITMDGPVPPVPGSLSRPVHSLQVVSRRTSMAGPTSADLEVGQFGGNQILGASVQGVFSWDLGSGVAANSVSRPTWVFTAPEKFCSSLVYDNIIETAVASLRPSPSRVSRVGVPTSCGAPSPGPGGTSAVPQRSTPVLPRHDQFLAGVDQIADSFPFLTMCVPSVAAFNTDEASHWTLQRHDRCPNGNEPQASNSANVSTNWKWVGEMTGHRSQTVLSRGVIIPRPNRSPLFASGDNLNGHVLVWDMGSSRIFQSLSSHESPVVDVRHIQSQDVDLIGCLSEESLRLYQKKRE